MEHHGHSDGQVAIDCSLRDFKVRIEAIRRWRKEFLQEYRFCFCSFQNHPVHFGFTKARMPYRIIIWSSNPARMSHSGLSWGVRIVSNSNSK